ncbi:MAG: VRR-NUC domain-containing protein [Deltaproteobacteria bacterium]|nr:VRR-NUC domain-containing protein [Deltaproteobacteria bacterium]
MREKEIEKYLGEQVKKLKGVSWKWTGTSGVPDRIVMLPGGQLMFVELKTAHGIVSPIQSVIHKRMKRLGFGVHVVRSKEDVDELLGCYKIKI